MNPLSLWWAEAKLYVFGALLVAFGVAFWWHGHAEYKAGAAAGAAQVSQLKTQYAQASQDAADAARAMQSMYDTQALAEAQARAASAEKQVEQVTSAQTAAERSAAKYESALKEERKHDASVDSWLGRSIPLGVRDPGESGSG